VALTDFENALDSTSEIELTTTGRVSGRETSRPVWFIRRDEKLYLLPVTGSRSQWYKNLLKTPAIVIYPLRSRRDGTISVDEAVSGRAEAGACSRYWPGGSYASNGGSSQRRIVRPVSG
jgi:hypothetical protein